MAEQDFSAIVDRLGRALGELDGVRLGLLFGSRARARSREDSDYDIGLLLDAEAALADRGETIRQLAARVGRVVSAAHLDLVVLNDAPSLLRHRILRDGIVLFQRSPAERVRFAIRTIRDYQDYQVRRDAWRRERIQRLKGKVETDDGRSRDLLEKARGAARLLAKAPRLP